MVCMSTARKVLIAVAGVLGALILVAVAAAFVYGPTMTAKFSGTARFWGTDTPRRYAKTVLDLSEEGIYGDSEEFRAARAAAEDAVQGGIFA